MVTGYRVDIDVLLGSGIARDAAQLFAEGRGRGLVVIGEHVLSTQSELANRLVEATGAERIVLGPLHNFEAIGALAARCATPTIEWIIAIGGGRVIDLSKALALRTHAGGSAFDACASHSEMQAMLDTSELVALPTCVIPTTVGSGAEVSALADVLRTSSGAKVPLISQALIPTKVIVDARVAASAPSAVRSAALFDCVMHIIDPWVGSLPEWPSLASSSEHVLAEVLALADRVASGTSSSDDVLELARLSHLALLPGLARPRGHVSCIHRIEHCLPLDDFASHGQGLAFVAVRFFAWLEARNGAPIRRLAAALGRAFGRRALPSELLGDLAGRLGLIDVGKKLPRQVVLEIARRVDKEFCDNGRLPGPLGVLHTEVEEILRLRPGQPTSTRRTTNRIAECPPNGERVFGMLGSPSANTVIVTPIPAIMRVVAPDWGNGSPAWFPAAPTQIANREALAVQTAPGSTAITDCLELLARWMPEPEEIHFLGLAGALAPDLALGQIVAPQGVFTDSGSGPVPTASQMVTDAQQRIIASVVHLSDETDQLFEYLAWHAVDLIDLETTAFWKWCEKRGCRFSVHVVVSDHPRVSDPIWAGSRNDGPFDLAGSAKAVVGELVSALRPSA